MAGREMTEELRSAISEGNKRAWSTPEHQAKQHAGHLGMRPGGIPATGTYITAQGYRSLTGQWDHPLRWANGEVLEHRKVLYDDIGDGPHECYWNHLSGCGKTELQWGGTGGIHADHLDGDKLNNSRENLVPSCLSCNRKGMRLASEVRRSVS